MKMFGRLLTCLIQSLIQKLPYLSTLLQALFPNSGHFLHHYNSLILPRIIIRGTHAAVSISARIRDGSTTHRPGDVEALLRMHQVRKTRDELRGGRQIHGSSDI